MIAVKMIAYRAETALTGLLTGATVDIPAARRLLQDLFVTEADILPDAENKILRIRVHGASRPAANRSYQSTALPVHPSPFMEAGFGVEPNKTESESSTGLQSAESTGSLNQPECPLNGFAYLFNMKKLPAGQRVRCTQFSGQPDILQVIAEVLPFILTQNSEGKCEKSPKITHIKSTIEMMGEIVNLGMAVVAGGDTVFGASCHYLIELDFSIDVPFLIEP